MSKGGEQEPEGPPPPLPCAAWVPLRSHITASQLKQTFDNDLPSPTEKSGGRVGCYCRVCGLSSRAEWGAATRPTWCFHSGLCPVAVLCHAFCCLRVLALWPLTCFILILVFCSVASVAAECLSSYLKVNLVARVKEELMLPMCSCRVGPEMT